MVSAGKFIPFLPYFEGYSVTSNRSSCHRCGRTSLTLVPRPEADQSMDGADTQTSGGMALHLVWREGSLKAVRPLSDRPANGTV